MTAAISSIHIPEELCDGALSSCTLLDFACAAISHKGYLHAGMPLQGLTINFKDRLTSIWKTVCFLSGAFRQR